MPYNVFEVETKITKEGSKISIDEYIDTREKLTRKKFWNQLDEDVEYSSKQLDDKVVRDCMKGFYIPTSFTPNKD